MLHHADALTEPEAGRGISLPALLIGYAVLYCLLDWVSYVHPIANTNITAWNPQWALAVALMMRSRQLLWPIAVSLAAAAVQPAIRHDPAIQLAASSIEVFGDVVIALALRRWVGTKTVLDTRREYLAFMLIVAIGSALQSGLYSTTLALSGGAGMAAVRSAFFSGWVASVNLVVALPLILVLADSLQRHELAKVLKTTEWWLVAATTVAIGYAVFARSLGDEFKLFYLLFLPAGWAAARFGNVGAIAASTLAQVVLISAVQSLPYTANAVFDLHMLLVALGATALLVGATVEERRQGERELRASLHAAAAANVAAALAQELHQPLTSLLNYARANQALAERMHAAGDQGAQSIADVARKLTNEALRASDVVLRLLSFFKIPSTDVRRADLAPLLHTVIRSCTSKAAAAGVILEFEDSGSLPSVLVDRMQIEVVLRNLLSNAVEASIRGVHALRLVSVDVAVEQDQVVVSVIDNGPGVPPEDLVRVFELQRSSKPQGAGMGLSISRNIVEAHRGRLWAEAGPGGRFFFSLPIAADTDEAR